MANFRITDTSSRSSSLTEAAFSDLRSLATINTPFSAQSWSLVCPNYSIIFPLESILAFSSSNLRTVDYIFPLSQANPNPTPRTWLINIITRETNGIHDFKMTMVLFTYAGYETESKIEFEGHGNLHDFELGGSLPGLLFYGICDVVAGTGTGIFEGAIGGRATFESRWSEEIVPPLGPEEWARPGLRIRPSSWSFLFEKDIADAFHFAVLKESL